jgi:probable phosphoglycerate mutase
VSIALIRHGQTEWSASGRHTSTTDIPLTPAGEAQAAALPTVLGGLGIRPADVWCSPRRRAVRTAELAGLPSGRTDDDLAEWDYGGYEGVTTAAIREDRPGWQLFTDGCPGGESPQQVGLRADRLLARAVERLRQLGASRPDRPGSGRDRPGTDLVLVCHGHISRVLAVRWVGLPVGDGALLAMDPAAVTVLDESAGERIIQHANVIALATIPTNGAST